MFSILSPLPARLSQIRLLSGQHKDGACWGRPAWQRLKRGMPLREEWSFDPYLFTISVIKPQTSTENISQLCWSFSAGRYFCFLWKRTESVSQHSFNTIRLQYFRASGNKFKFVVVIFWSINNKARCMQTLSPLYFPCAASILLMKLMCFCAFLNCTFLIL